MGARSCMSRAPNAHASPLMRAVRLTPSLPAASLAKKREGRSLVPASPRKSYAELRSARWYGASDLRSFGHRSRTKQMGFAAEDYAGKPVIAILNTWSDLNPCHYHFRERAAEVKRGVWQAGGFPRS